MCEEPTDPELVEAANSGDRTALEALYRRHRDWVYGQAFRACGSREDALDITQQVFIYFLGKFPGLELRCQVRTLLYPVIRHRVADLMRQRDRRESVKSGLVAEDGQQRPPDSDTVEDLVATLPPPQRDVLLLRFTQGLRLAEIATRLGIPPGTVKSRLHNALEKLRRTL